MKIISGFTLLLYSIIGVYSSTVCDPASVYIFSSKSVQKSTHEAPILNHQQSQLVLADIVGTSRLHSISNTEEAHIIKGLSGKSALFGIEENSIVIVIGGVRGEDFLDTKPTFKIDRSPDIHFFKSHFERIASELSELKGKIRHAVSEGFAVLTHHGHLTRDIIELENSGLDKTHPKEREIVNDISKISSLTSTVLHNDGALLHIDSLIGLNTEQYIKGVQAIQKSLEHVLDNSKAFRIAVIAVPINACQHVDGLQSGNVKRSVVSRSAGTASTSGFGTFDVCMNSTNSCSGHGSCKEVTTDKYACVCENSYNATRKKTTRWAGNACQKKDVSVEFEMFLWTGLGITAVIAFGINLMFSIGNDPLPGVLNIAKKA